MKKNYLNQTERIWKVRQKVQRIQNSIFTKQMSFNIPTMNPLKKADFPRKRWSQSMDNVAKSSDFSYVLIKVNLPKNIIYQKLYSQLMQQKLQQRHLNFNKFVEERSVEIAKFLGDLEMDTKKKGHQALPRTVRRRAMSHNRYRIPRKMRKCMEQDLAKAQTMLKIPKCRKHIRKRRNLIMAYKLRSSKVHWLSTHLWSARRMRMIEYYGYKIAQTSSNKCFRSAYRHFRHNSCLIDLSYFNCLSLKFEQNNLPCLIDLKSQQIVPEFQKIYEIDLYSSDSREKLICPAFLVRFHQNESRLCLKIFFHPAALNQIKKLKINGKVSAVLQQGQSDIYLLIGPESANILSESLSKYGISNSPTTLTTAFMSNKHKLLYFKKNDDFEIVNKPEVDCPILPEKQLKKSYDINENISVRKNILQIYQNLKESLTPHENQKPQQNHESFWKFYEAGQNKQLQDTVFKVTLRSKYTHKRKNKVSKQQKKKIAQIQKQSPKPRRNKKQGSMKDESEVSQSLNFSKQIYLETPLHKTAVLSQIHPVMVGCIGSQAMKSFLIFGSNANSCRLWRTVSHQNVKVIGRRQLSHMYLQTANLLFPENYVQTDSFKECFNDKRQKIFRKYFKMPLNKRPNYFQLNSPHPFGLQPEKSIIISLQMVGKGRCFQMSYICQLLPSDLPIISDLMTKGNVGIICSETKSQIKPSKKHYKDISEIQFDLKLCQSTRKVIGQITTGGFLFHRNREGGTGFINKALLTQNYLQSYGGYFLIRKNTSRHYMLAISTKYYQ